ncbi:MAG TPA: hypothetical protein PLZ57_11165 [Pseudobdellovibrionaceae bacterium]|nr:hypothetical protein [Pseudobdellovibrionaceae bacterium]
MAPRWSKVNSDWIRNSAMAVVSVSLVVGLVFLFQNCAGQFQIDEESYADLASLSQSRQGSQPGVPLDQVGGGGTPRPSPTSSPGSTSTPSPTPGPTPNGQTPTPTPSMTPSASATPSPTPAQVSDYERNIGPVVAAKCLQCHSATLASGGYNFANSNLVAASGSAMLSAIDGGRMPPSGSTPISTAERNLLANWLATKTVNGVPIPGEQNIPTRAYTPPTPTPSSSPTPTPTATATPTATPGPGQSVFELSVGPALKNRCLQCHSSGRIAANLDFSNSNNVAALGVNMLSAVDGGRMPPWAIDQSGTCGSFHGDMRMSSSERAALSSWLTMKTVNGVPVRGEENRSLAPSSLPSLQPNGSDIKSLSMKAPYRPSPPSGSVDEYRCFVIDPLDLQDKHITAFEVKPGNRLLVHHVILYMPTSQQAELDAVAKTQGRPDASYPCHGGIDVPAVPLVIWAPGTGVEYLPQGTGLKVTGNRKLVMQMHYNNSQAPGAQDQSQIVVKTATSAVASAEWVAYEANGTALPALSDNIVRERTQAAHVPSTNTKIHGYMPHMHNHGKRIQISKISGGAETCLARVNRFDFNWQFNYFSTSPTNLASADQIKVRCEYSTNNPRSTTPVQFGENTNQEMCFVFAYQTSAPPPATDYAFQLIEDSGPITARSIRVRARVSPSHVGQEGRVFIAVKIGTSFYYMRADGQFIAVPNFDSPLPAYFAGALPAEVNATLAQQADLTGILGAEIYVGYGLGADAQATPEHLAAGRFAKVLTIGSTPTMSTPGTGTPTPTATPSPTPSPSPSPTPSATPSPASYSVASVSGPITARNLSLRVQPRSDHRGMSGRIYVMAFIGGKMYYMDENRNFSEIQDPATQTVPVAQRVTLGLVHDVVVTQQSDLSTLTGNTVYIGYGVGATDNEAKLQMLNSGQYAPVYTIAP